MGRRPGGADLHQGGGVLTHTVRPDEPALQQREPAATRRRFALLVAVLAIIVAVVLSLAVGARSLDPVQVWHGLFGADPTGAESVVRDFRVPRTLLGLLAGLAFGLAGALIQALTRNPLGDPGILGVNAGASFATVIGVGYLGLTSIHGYIWAALVGAVLTTAMVYVVGAAGRNGGDPVRLTLVGVAVGAVLVGISNGITLLDPRSFDKLRYWAVGALGGATMPTVTAVAPLILAGAVLALLLARSLNAMALGDDLARTLGTRLALTRLLGIVAVTLLAGTATAAMGPILFLGLVVPHLARWLVGPDQRWIMVMTLLLSPALLLIADVIGRVVLRPGEIAAGLITAFVGSPVLIWWLRRRKLTEQ